MIRNPHALLIDDGQLAKNAHKTQKSDWTPGGRGRGREGERERRAWRERALDKNEGSRATTLFCVNRDRLYDSRPGWNLKIRPSGAAAAAAAAGGSCTQGRQLKLSKQQQLLFDPVRKTFFSGVRGGGGEVQTQLDPLWRTLASLQTLESRFAIPPSAASASSASASALRLSLFEFRSEKNTIWRK